MLEHNNHRHPVGTEPLGEARTNGIHRVRQSRTSCGFLPFERCSRIAAGMTFILLLLIPNLVYANCYSPQQAAADQGIRIHSELMVIGLNCQHMGKRAGQNLYGTYREFTAKHANIFESFEQTMLSFYKGRGDTKPEDSLNALRTGYANKISADAAALRPDVFCARYAPRVVQAAEFDASALQSWAATIYDTHPVSYPICGG